MIPGRSLVVATLICALSLPAASGPAAAGAHSRSRSPAASAALARATPAMLAALSAARPVPPRNGPLAIASRDVLVVPRDPASIRIGVGARLEAGDPAFRSALTRLGLDRAEVVGRAGKRGGAPRVLKLSSASATFDPVEAARALRATGLFRAASPNYRLHLFPTFPNDTYLGDQWYVHDVSDDDVDLPDAWDTEKGAPSVLIGIMDTGVDLGHPDLASKIWSNPGEIPGNSLDDDGNGYVDDVSGWDFGNDDADPNPEPVFDEIGLDIGFHGTFVAGIASAATNNGQGIAGAGWDCRLMPLKVSNSAGEITSEAVAAAFLYATDLQIGVLNMSLGGPGDPGVPEFFQALVDAADSAGVLCVAAAGNSSTDVPSYPAACDRVLSVAALDRGDIRAEFSNYGSWVDIAAPGASMWSSICRNYTIDDLSQIFYIYFFGWDGENPYMFGDGTSFACPLTAGVCGLVRHRSPAATPQQVALAVIATGDPITTDQPVGPKLNAYQAIAPIVAVEDAPLRSLSLDGVPNPFRSSTVLAFTTPVAGWVRFGVYDLAGRLVGEVANEPLPAGRHVREWKAATASGSRLASGIYVAVLESGGLRVRQKLVLLR